MNKKERLYTVLGGVIGTVLTMVVCSFSPLGAHPRDRSTIDAPGDFLCTLVASSYTVAAYR